MRPIDEALIEKGKKLNRLLESDDFKPFLDQLTERIEDAKERTLNASPFFPDTIRVFQAQHLALVDLRAWIDEEIERAGNEIMRKASDLPQSERTGREVK